MLHFNPHLKSIKTSVLHSKCNIQIKTQYLFTSPSFPGVGMVGKCEGNVNLHSILSLFIRSITLLSTYSRTLLTTFLQFSHIRIFGDIAFWNKTSQMLKNLTFNSQPLPRTILASNVTSSCWLGITTRKLALALVDVVVGEDIFDGSSILSWRFGGIGEGPGEGDLPRTGDDEFGYPLLISSIEPPGYTVKKLI